MANNGQQQPRIYPGFAIFRFPAGIVQIVLRISLAILLIACLVTAAIQVGSGFNSVSSSLNNENYYRFMASILTAFWLVIVTPVALFLELIYFVLRFLNIRCYNNYYILYGVIDIFRYVGLAICMLLACAGYASDVHSARQRADTYDREAAVHGEVDTASEELRDYAIVITVYAVLCGVTVAVIIALIVWEIIYLSACCNNRLPVPREGDDEADKS